MGKHLGEQLGERRPRLQKAEEIHTARQTLDDVAQAIERMVGMSASGDRRQERREHRFKRLPRRGRAQRPRLPRSPIADMPGGGLGVGEADPLQLGREDIGIVRQRVALIARHAIENPPHPLDVRAKRFEQLAAAREPVQPSDIVERGLARRKQVSLRILDHLHPVLDRSQQAVGAGQLVRHGAVDPPGIVQRLDRVERRGRAHR